MPLNSESLALSLELGIIDSVLNRNSCSSLARGNVTLGNCGLEIIYEDYTSILSLLEQLQQPLQKSLAKILI
jgi:hypothetical protein